MASDPRQRILPLSAEAISQIHSSKHITSLQGVVLSLLENSLDASATKVDITVDWRRGGCTIDDNGLGIPAAEFAENGGLGKMYCTSKRAPVGNMTNQLTELHGSNGMFLAELAAMSLLAITSTGPKTRGPASITLHLGKAISRSTSDPGTAGFESAQGTSVSVRDLFGNMPVRVKQRSLAEGGYDKHWQELKRGVVALLLAGPRPCVVRLRDADNDTRATTISGQHPSISTNPTDKALGQLAGKKSRFDPRDALPVLFQAGLASVESKSRWIPLSASSSAATLKGLICLDPAPTKQCQFVALGIRPCNPMTGHSELHDAVNKTFSNSSFGVLDNTDDVDGASKTRNGELPAKQAKAQRGVDRHPMYFLQLSVHGRGPKSSSDLETLSAASLKTITDVLEAAVSAWLDKNHFRPRKRRRRRNEDQTAPASSPVVSRPSSATSTPHNGTRARLTPSFPQEAEQQREIISSRPTSKRQKIIDLSLRPGFNRPDSGELERTSTDVSNLSNIRSGRESSRSYKAQTTDSLPPALDDTIDNPTFRSLAFKAHLTDKEPAPPKSKYDAFSKQTSKQGNLQDQVEKVPSSEDFGSFDDAEMIAAMEGRQRGESGPTQTAQSHLGDHDTEGEDGSVTWRDPISQQVFRVNSRTGVVLPLSGENHSSMGPGDNSSLARRRAGIDTALSSAGKPLSLLRRAALAQKEKEIGAEESEPTWLPGFLREWNNPVFARQQEEAIPSASVHGPGLVEVDDHGRHCSHGAANAHRSGEDFGVKLSKEALKHVEVIGQVDRKFILCKIPSSGDEDGRTLVLIDQHAASERVILESLLSELLTTDESGTTQIKTTNLQHQTAKAKPLRFEVSQQEHELFQRYEDHFRTWGIFYSQSITNPHNKASHRLTITSLPTAIAERCSNLPNLAVDLLRSEVWALADGSKRSLSHLPANPSWTTLLPLMPSKLLEMLHSRSCRSAIMFNDALSKQECEALMAKLAECVFPFICAHGRVSMVPLVEVGEVRGLMGQDEIEKQEGRERCDTATLLAWMKTRTSVAEK